jgi:hypothetical protein
LTEILCFSNIDWRKSKLFNVSIRVTGNFDF